MLDPTQALQQLLQPAGLPATLFPSTSRYFGIATDTFERPGGEPVIYLTRRFVPAPDAFDLLQEHVVVEGERLDNLAATFVGDPEQFWRLADANGALLPWELEEPGRRLRITLPLGVPPGRNA
jgi:hypothetical protein